MNYELEGASIFHKEIEPIREQTTYECEGFSYEHKYLLKQNDQSKYQSTREISPDASERIRWTIYERFAGHLRGKQREKEINNTCFAWIDQEIAIAEFHIHFGHFQFSQYEKKNKLCPKIRREK